MYKLVNEVGVGGRMESGGQDQKYGNNEYSAGVEAAKGISHTVIGSQ